VGGGFNTRKISGNTHPLPQGGTDFMPPDALCLIGVSANYNADPSDPIDH